MKRAIGVFLGDGPQIGTLYYDRQRRRENAAFEYSREWLSHDERYPFGPTLPLVPGPQFHKRAGDGSVFHDAIADTEPDGWGRRVIRRDQMKQREARRRTGEDDDAALNSMDFLLAVDDASRIGALRFADEEGVFQSPAEAGRRTAPPLIELAALMSASHAVENNTETTADLAYLRGRGTTLGGVRPKCTVVDDDRRLAIGKFPSVTDDRAVTKGEVLALCLAHEAGINAAAARVVESDGFPVAVIRRFDRDRDGQRIMYVSAATMIGVDRRDPEEHSYAEIADAIRVRGAEAQADIEELWRRIAFSILITNTDDHLLNHGFLHETGDLWRLSPAFDINPAPDRARELSLWITEDTGPEATISNLIAAAPYFRIQPNRAKAILASIEKVISQWREKGREIGMTEAELDPFTTAFEHPERDAVRAIL
jgi:serine/threonine-protein kinase HipA